MVFKAGNTKKGTRVELHGNANSGFTVYHHAPGKEYVRDILSIDNFKDLKSARKRYSEFFK